jgi:glycosyltransferase involved in cell wall biosynthesis
MLNIQFIEPYDGGSHRSFRQGLEQYSDHNIKSLTLPARFWKWRMRGSAMLFADLINEQQPPVDLFFVTDYLNVADFKGMLNQPYDRTPILLYMHENQLTYPLSPEEEFDFHFGFTNIVSCMAAEKVIFNSEFHRQLFLDAIPKYVGKMPESIPKNIQPRIREKSLSLPVGIGREPGHSDLGEIPKEPIILWNHRWEFDKRPEMFTRAILRLLDSGITVKVMLLGEERQNEKNFALLAEKLGKNLLHSGFLPSRDDYNRCLEQADIIVSCAAQEYFGISVAEAIHAGCYPLLPREQVYPSLYSSCNENHLYDDEDELVKMLSKLIEGRYLHDCPLPLQCNDYCWQNLTPLYDKLFNDTVNQRT